MSNSTPSTKLTYEDYLLFPEDGNRHEILDGEHTMTPAPNTRHQRLIRRLLMMLTPFVEEHRLGEVFCASYDVVLSEETIVQPDLMFVATTNMAMITPQNIQGAPDLLVEILSPATRKKDEGTKRKLYERFHVQEYWIVDPELELLKYYRYDAEAFQQAVELSVDGHATFSTPLLPGFSLSLQDLFA